MVKQPRVVGLILCEALEVDPSAGRMSLSGIFNVLPSRTWPVRTPFTAYTVLQGGQGEGTMELVVTRLETEADVYRHRRWFALPGPDLMVHVEIRVRRPAFPAPGRYRVSLRFNQSELTWRLLDVVERNGDS